MKYSSFKKGQFEITTDPSKIDIDRLHQFLAKESYWSQNIPRSLLEKAILHSLNFSVLEFDTQKFVGFARIITDFATFAYLADVFIDKEYRGHDLGKWLIQIIMEYKEIQGLRNWFLYTKDAQGLYSKYGWKPLENPEFAMAIKMPAVELYKDK